jgi:predicted RNase H-like HicB family nuclease
MNQPQLMNQPSDCQAFDLWDPPGEEWPLLFVHTFEVRGPRFAASVTIDGALVATLADDESCWIDGVYPYAVAGEGASLQEAYENVKTFMAGCLEDIVREATSFDEFKSALNDFATYPGDTCALSAWRRGVQKVRAGGVTVPSDGLRSSEGWSPSIEAIETRASTSTSKAARPATASNLAHAA